MARRYLILSPDEWAGLSWAMQNTYLEGFYTEDILQRPERLPAALDMTPPGVNVPDDVRSLTAAGTGYRAIEAPAFDLGAMIADLEKQRPKG
jgi:hypothetical protein